MLSLARSSAFIGDCSLSLSLSFRLYRFQKQMGKKKSVANNDKNVQYYIVSYLEIPLAFRAYISRKT